MQVKPVGEFVFEKDSREHRIPASQLSQGEPTKESDGFQGESEDWSVIFTAESVFGEFAWNVNFTIGELGATDSGIVKMPSGVEVISDLFFKLV